MCLCMCVYLYCGDRRSKRECDVSRDGTRVRKSTNEQQDGMDRVKE